MGTVYNKNGGGGRVSFNYTAYSSATAGGSSRAVAYSNYTNTLNFPKSVNVEVAYVSGSGWTVNRQSFGAGVVRTFSNITSLQFVNSLQSPAGGNTAITMTVQITIK